MSPSGIAVTVVLPVDLHNRLAAVAAQQGRGMEELIRFALEIQLWGTPQPGLGSAEPRPGYGGRSVEARPTPSRVRPSNEPKR